MNHRKSNRVRWYILGLALVLAVGCGISAAGVSFARYRVASTHELQFEPRSLKFFHTGALVQETVTDEASGETTTKEVFQKSDSNSWQYANGINTTTFAVANAAADETGAIRIPAEDQHLQIRFLGSLGLWTGSSPSTVTLTMRQSHMDLAQEAQIAAASETEATEASEATTAPASEDPEAQTETPAAQAEEETEKTVTVTAKAISIKQGSHLHETFGAGWVFVFQDDRGQELTWTLEGGKQSYVEFTISVAGVEITSPYLAQMQIIGEPDT